ncbi:signal peptidase I [Rhodococcus sp. NyZ502]|uniref:signal peptidase I n=1 Tax=unclassified Rhodococcus (in: high G+C Gram-positive bacteria) TaxID=192944 RepID=UPI00254AAE66|nr:MULTISPECIES: signal peptidase I [unclassified Rhodococcus (in: high G+C Gram-positive bacteria)]WNF40782.1 signal peptidase I [Rhodococcus sp. SG20037]
MSDHTTPGSSRSARAGRELALTVGAVAGLICVLAAAASMLFGIKPLVFRSGSMSPEIATGSMALAHTVPATDLAVGDVVSVVNGQGTRITHRVYELDQQAGNSVTVTLKGDANAKPDAEPYFITEADRIFFSVSGLGYAIAWLSSPLAIFLGGALVGGLVIIAFRPNSRRKDSDDGPSGGIGSVDTEAAATMEFPMVSSSSGTGGHSSAFSLRKLTVLGVSAFALIGVTQVGGTAAAFTDNSTATSGALQVSSNVLPKPGSISCGNSGSAGFRWTKITWPHMGSPFTYRVLVYRDNSELRYTKNVDPGVNAAIGASQLVELGAGELGIHTNWNYTARIYSVNRVTGEIGTEWGGYNLRQATTNDVVCGSGNSGNTAAAFVETEPLARGVAPTTTTAAETTTTSAPTGTSTTAPTTTDVTTTTGAPLTTESSTSTTTQSTTPTTTTDATTTTTTTTKQPPVALGAAETSLTGYDATLMQDGASVAVVVTDSSGAEVSSTPVSATATVMWQSDADELWIMDGANVYRVNAETGVSEKNPSGEAPAEIAAWIDGQK